MILRSVALFLVSALLGSCAYQGVVVDKAARELPFSETIGMPGSFALMLRDSSGAVHRQLVTPDVYARYEVGDYFNDTQSGPAPRDHGAGDKVMLTASRSVGYTPIASTRPAASTRATVASAPAPATHNASHSAKTGIASKKHKSHHSIAAKKRAASKKRIARAAFHKTEVEARSDAPAPSAPAAQPGDAPAPPSADIVDVGAAPPR